MYSVLSLSFLGSESGVQGVRRPAGRSSAGRQKRRQLARNSRRRASAGAVKCVYGPPAQELWHCAKPNPSPTSTKTKKTYYKRI